MSLINPSRTKLRNIGNISHRLGASNVQVMPATSGDAESLTLLAARKGEPPGGQSEAQSTKHQRMICSILVRLGNGETCSIIFASRVCRPLKKGSYKML